MDMLKIAQQAKKASRALARAATAAKDQAILRIADELETRQGRILAANALDMQAAAQSGMSAALQDRLLLNPARLAAIANDLRAVASLPDPVGEVFDESTLPNGMRLRKQRVPLGVLGVIYESRPNVTIDVAGLALKTGNACILRGGRETLNSNMALVQAVQAGLQAADLPAESVQAITDPNRALMLQLLKLDDYVDMIIPRGGGRAARVLPRAQPRAGDDRRHGRVPPVCRCQRRPRRLFEDHPQRAHPKTQRLQQPGYAVGAPPDRGRLFATGGGAAGQGWGEL